MAHRESVVSEPGGFCASNEFESEPGIAVRGRQVHSLAQRHHRAFEFVALPDVRGWEEDCRRLSTASWLSSRDGNQRPCRGWPGGGSTGAAKSSSYPANPNSWSQ